MRLPLPVRLLLLTLCPCFVRAVTGPVLLDAEFPGEARSREGPSRNLPLVATLDQRFLWDGWRYIENLKNQDCCK